MATRRYFAKFDRIIGHLRDVHALTPAAHDANAGVYVSVIEACLVRLSLTFKALSYKHLIAKQISGALPQDLEIDRRDSGFPVYREILQMVNDLAQVRNHLDSLPPASRLKNEMIDHMLRELTPPRRLQFALSQRLYYEILDDGLLFLGQNHPEQILLPDTPEGRRRYLVHWSVYDSQENLPTVYLMEVVDNGATPLPRDERRWPRLQSHLLAQAMSSLKLVTIATGVDTDFEDLQPKRLMRIHLGPMYSDFFTRQDGPLREVLAEAAGETGQDWALSWTVENLQSVRTEKKSSGLFSSVEREIYDLDSTARNDRDTGASSVERSLILPQRPYQVLVDRDFPGLRSVRKFVVGAGGRVLSDM